ncbi:hypothetical protein K435DRAFT_863304 [Dendrothele bispora CBS 962.96]|uniref:DRBM domain-containing protein n=1 Tax=Dendrothele bispora (strain CBS 962.96) TaxID=1314807 RepID=A0A4S8LRG8_DENBC|nr:hypothetical protein K435DRAFT_863304 [Dendrothele bispora CBS 962.96]
MAQSRGLTPVYADSFSGPQHAPTWTSTVSINNQQYGTGQGTSRGAARENAARQALQVIAASNGR